MYQQQHSKDNMKAALGSQIVAKALCQRSNGTYEMIVVFAASTRIEFFWTFTVRSPRSPRRTWKFTGYFNRDLNQHYHDFGSFVSQHALLHHAEILSIRMPQKRLLTSLLRKTAHESIFADWSPAQVPSNAPMGFAHKRAGNGHKGKRSAWAY